MAASPKAKTKPKTVDEYLAALRPEQRAALERLRATIHAAAPGAEECISYHLPAFKLNGKCFLWIGAAATHCAIYGAGNTYAAELSKYDTNGKGTIRFQPDKPLPAALVKKLVKERIARSALKAHG